MSPALARVSMSALLVPVVLHGILGLGTVGEIAAGVSGTAVFAITALLAIARGLTNRRTRVAGLAIGLGLLAWTAAYAFYFFDAQPWSGLPAASDVAWIAGYLGFYTGLISIARSRVARSAGVWLDGLSGSLALAAVAVAVIVPIVRRLVDGSVGTMAVALAYPLADAMLLCFIAVMSTLVARRPDRGFGRLIAAFALLVASDLPYFWGTANGTFEPGGVSDLGWMLAAALMAGALWQPPPARPRATGTPGMALVFPIGSAVVGVAVLASDTLAEVPAAAGALASLACGAALLRVLLSYRELHELLESRRLSLTDDLTGLGNRRRLMRDLSATLRRGAAGLLLLDLDGFKELNDALGHHAGDAVLRAVAARLGEGLRDGDLAARLGGDEFAVVLRGADREATHAIAERLAEAVAEPITVDGVTLRVRASIGVVTAPADGREAELLLRRADLAMYRAKAQPGAVAAHAEGADDDALDRLRLAAELEDALDNGELVLHYQPIADARTGRIRAVEALVRWQHPRRGLLFPGAFLPALERTTMTHRFSRMMLEAAIVQSVAFREAGRTLRVAVNLTPADVLDAGLPAEIAQQLLTHRARPEDLMVEVTETGVLSDFDRAHDVIEGIRALGVAVALDDFGTGHSSLTHLQRLPVDTLKVDRSFVADVVDQPATAAIVRSMIELAHTLGQRVVAEGVEDAVLWQRLASWGCDMAQGWVVGRAVPAGELLATLGELDARAAAAAGRERLHVVA